MGLGLDSNRKKSEQDSDNIAELEFDDMDDVKAKGNKVNPQFIIIGAIVVVVVAAAFILLRKEHRHRIRTAPASVRKSAAGCRGFHGRVGDRSRNTVLTGNS